MAAPIYSGTIGHSPQWPGGIAKFRRRAVVICYAVLAVGAFFILNWAYQVFRKPGEIFGPVSGSLSKSPQITWQSYGPLFEKYSTSILSSEFLAALAQVEGNGNPVARTYWRWEWSWNPFKIYRPASSALGMFQITDGTFAEARKYCIHDHKLVSEGPWYDLGSCWFNGLYTRILPSHAIEMTAAYLHQSVMNMLAARRITKAGLAQKQKLAAVIHLCGAKRGENFVRRRFLVAKGERCGAESLGRYLTQIDLMKQRFVRLKESEAHASPAKLAS